MYSLNCIYYTKRFPNIDNLLHDIIHTGMDPNYYITLDGISTNEKAIDLINP